MKAIRLFRKTKYRVRVTGEPDRFFRTREEADEYIEVLIYGQKVSHLSDEERYRVEIELLKAGEPALWWWMDRREGNIWRFLAQGLTATMLEMIPAR